MLSLGNSLELAVASNLTTAEQYARREEVASMSATPKRAIAKGLLGLVQRHPGGGKLALNQMAKRRGYSYLGSGNEFSVYLEHHTDEVVKIHRQSARLTPQQRAELVHEKHREFHGLLPHLSAFTLQQAVDIGAHVLDEREVVRLRQPFVPFDPTDNPLVNSHPGIDIEKLAAITQRIPGVDEAYADFVASSWSMYQDRGLLPDTNGTDNIVAKTDGSLALLDSTPAVLTHHETRELIFAQLAALEQGLREVA